MGFNLLNAIERLPPDDARDALRRRLDAYRDLTPQPFPDALRSSGLEACAETDRLRRVEPVVICAEDLNSEILDSAIRNSSGLIVRNLVDPEMCAQLRQVVDNVLDAQSPHQAPSAYRNSPENLVAILGEEKLGNSRGFHALSGSAMCVESAGVCEGLLELYDRLGLPTVLREFFAGDYCLSALKWVLRRSKLPVSPFGWHQDGAFMGSNIRSVNMWMSLSDCGGDSNAPGLDIVARNLKSVVNAGQAGAAFSWSFDSAGIDNLFGPDAVTSPRFGEGDVFFFDHFMLHRTQSRAGQDRIRYALETWFFDGARYPSNQVPLAAVRQDDPPSGHPC